jgi:3-deoxy-7-phosphoheptulonate synthase
MDRNDRIRNRRIVRIRPLVSPREVCARHPLSDADETLVSTSRNAAARILDREDDRLLVVVGPCSVHDPAAALDYARRLKAVADRLSDRIFVIMRVYFEKPRTTLGWKGLIYDPALDGTNRVNEGLSTARELLVSILSLGLPVGCEFLDPITPQYIADAVTWGAIGARTVKSQIHRQLASGLSMPVGFKNSTDGDVQGAVDALAAAASPQVFPGITDEGNAAICATAGNPDCHVVLRGGERGANYDSASVTDLYGRLERSGLPKRVVIDASHGNSGKDHHRQSVVVRDVAARIAAGEGGVVGLMLESFLAEGRQDLVLGQAKALRYGQSITDACLGWDATLDLLETLSEAAARRRSPVNA